MDKPESDEASLSATSRSPSPSEKDQPAETPEQREQRLLERRKAKDALKKQAEEAKKAKRKQKKDEKAKTKQGEESKAKSKVMPSITQKNALLKVAQPKQVILDDEMGDKPLPLPKDTPKVELVAKDEKNTLFLVGEEEVVVANTDVDRLEAIRRQREMDAKEREVEDRRKEKMKEESKAEFLKLQEKLAAKNDLKNKKSKKR